jgi:hypothetical protein
MVFSDLNLSVKKGEIVTRTKKSLFLFCRKSMEIQIVSHTWRSADVCFLNLLEFDLKQRLTTEILTSIKKKRYIQ